MDMQKAYDRLDWTVLTRILTLIGFSDRTVKLILNCISSVSMELLLNGSVFGKIPMERGLRQGDLLSPFLFILLSELLSRILHKWEREGKINGVKLGRWTRQAINVDKSGCFFSRNVLERPKALIKSILGIRELSKKTKYLGIPLFMDRNKVVAFEDLKNKVESKIQGWKAKLLSQTGRVTLIKHVVTSVPVYSMSTFLLVKFWCDKVEKISRAFIWRNNPNLGEASIRWLGARVVHREEMAMLLLLYRGYGTDRVANRATHLVGQWAKHQNFYGEVILSSLPSSIALYMIQESDVSVAP
nr:uncharacterized protein LOC125422659 [Ziziphus jujuba var. spinosa]